MLIVSTRPFPRKSRASSAKTSRRLQLDSQCRLVFSFSSVSYLCFLILLFLFVISNTVSHLSVSLSLEHEQGMFWTSWCVCLCMRLQGTVFSLKAGTHYANNVEILGEDAHIIAETNQAVINTNTPDDDSVNFGTTFLDCGLGMCLLLFPPFSSPRLLSLSITLSIPFSHSSFFHLCLNHLKSSTLHLYCCIYKTLFSQSR